MRHEGGLRPGRVHDLRPAKLRWVLRLLRRLRRRGLQEQLRHRRRKLRQLRPGFVRRRGVPLKPLLLMMPLCALPALGQSQTAPKQVRLDHQRSLDASACPDEPALRRNVAERLGYDPFVDTAEGTLKTRIERAGEELVAELVLIGADGAILGRRTLTSSGTDCEELASSMALAVAIAVDPLVITRPPAPPPPTDAAPDTSTDDDWAGFPPNAPAAPPTSTSTAGLPPRAEPPAVARPPPAVSEPRWLQVGLVGLASLGTAPAIAPGLSLQGGYRSQTAFFGLEARADVPTSIEAGRGEISAGQLVGGLVACAHRLWVGICGVGSAGVLRSQGIGLLNPQSASTLWVTLGGRALLDIPLTPAVRLRFQGDLTAQPTRTSLMVGTESVWKSPTVSLTLGGGVTWSPGR